MLVSIRFHTDQPKAFFATLTLHLITNGMKKLKIKPKKQQLDYSSLFLIVHVDGQLLTQLVNRVLYV